MTKINESSDVLDIIHTRSWIDKIFHLLAAMALLAPVALFLFWGAKPEADARYPEFAPVAAVIIGTFLLVSGLFFLAKVFEANSYYFDKTADKFYLKGRKYFFRKWAIEGAVSDITSVSYQIFGQDENIWSEIFLTYRFYGSVTETIKCGTGDRIEDDIITTYIKNFYRIGQN